MSMKPLPRLLFTMGDAAGVGPEIIARAWPQLHALCRPVVVGDRAWLERAVQLVGTPVRIMTTKDPATVEATPAIMPCLEGSSADLSRVQSGQVSAAAGRAAYDYLCTAIDLTLARAADGIVTAPLHKEGLRAAGVHHPGHTEILAERTGTSHFAMLLYVKGLAVAHVTLHMALREVFGHPSAWQP
jgi:4-hydroxy-L-threonine phosphate dehydrogenase PdxA